MKFVLLVEGKTEKDSAAGFLKRWLDPRLSRPIGIQCVAFDGYADCVRKMATKARMHLDGPQRSDVIAVIGLLDLYGPQFYPPDKTSVKERVDWGVQHFENEVGLSKFRMFFAVHEFEAWLLSQPQIFPQEVQARLASSSAAPETVNSTEPPAKLLNQIYLSTMNRGYKKTTFGKQLFARLQPEAAIAKCPYLKSMLEEMLQMAKAAGL